MSRILIVDPQPLARLALRTLAAADGHEVVAEADSGGDALTLCRQLQPDLIILELGTPGLGGLEVIGRFKRQRPELKVLVCSEQDAEHFAARSLAEGADGFVSKLQDVDALRAAVRTVLQGRAHFSSEVLAGPRVDELGQLSSRELIVLQLLTRGLSNTEIAEQLALSVKTVSTYKTRLQTKLHAASLVDLVEVARRNGLCLQKDAAIDVARSDDATQHELQMLRAMVDNAPDPMFVRDVEGRLLLANQRYLSFHRISASQAHLLRPGESEWFAPQQRSNIQQLYVDAVAMGKSFDGDFVIESSGERKPVRGWCVPFRGADGRVLGMVGGLIDLSERNKLLSQLRNAKERADAANREKSALLFELGGTLRTALLEMDARLDAALTAGPDLARREIGQADEALRALLALLDELLLPDAGAQPCAADLASLTKQAVDARPPNRQAPMLDLSAAAITGVWVNPQRYMQIVTGLLIGIDGGRLTLTSAAGAQGLVAVHLQLDVDDAATLAGDTLAVATFGRAVSKGLVTELDGQLRQSDTRVEVDLLLPAALEQLPDAAM